MRNVALLGAVVFTAMLATGCSADDESAVTLGGSGSSSSTPLSALTPDGLTQYVTVNGPGLTSGNNVTPSVTITTWLANNSEAPITATIRSCAILSDDIVTVDSLQLFGPGQADCGADTVQTATFAPFAQTTPIQNTFPWLASGGTYQIAVRLVLQPVYWMTITIGDQ